MLAIIINLNIWVLTILGYVVYNLYKKNVKLEEMVQQRDQTLAAIGGTVNESDRVLKELDKVGAFQSDDEVGFFFKALKQIQEVLNQFYKGKD
jgi:hypothetical protein